MKQIKQILIGIYKKFFRVAWPVEGLIPSEFIVWDRMFFYGLTRMFVDSILMESAPGTYETILRFLRDTYWEKSVSILDYGCGQHQSKYLNLLYPESVVSADILDFDLPNFIKINPENYRIELEDGSKDVVIASEVIEHVYSPFKLLEELIRISSKYVIISTPNPASIKSRLQFFLSGYHFWFAPENWEYHVTPVFYWQIEKFLSEKNLKFTRYANHSFFWLKGDDVRNAESFVYIITKE